MASDGVPVKAAVQATQVAPAAQVSKVAPVAKFAQGILPLAAGTSRPVSGKTLPASGAHPADGAYPAPPGGQAQAQVPAQPQPQTPGTTPAAKPAPDLQALTAELNKHFQESGRPTQFRLDSSSGRTMIQEVNPDTGKVIGEIPASEFEGLAQGLKQDVGVPGLLLDTRA